MSQPIAHLKYLNLSYKIAGLRILDSGPAFETEVPTRRNAFFELLLNLVFAAMLVDDHVERQKTSRSDLRGSSLSPLVR